MIVSGLVKQRALVGDLRWVHDHGHTTLAMSLSRAVQPQRISAVNLESPDIAIVGETRVDG
jgi:hypothetical protein